MPLLKSCFYKTLVGVNVAHLISRWATEQITFCGYKDNFWHIFSNLLFQMSRFETAGRLKFYDTSSRHIWNDRMSHTTINTKQLWDMIKFKKKIQFERF